MSLRLQGICLECWTKMSTGHFGSRLDQIQNFVKKTGQSPWSNHSHLVFQSHGVYASCFCGGAPWRGDGSGFWRKVAEASWVLCTLVQFICWMGRVTVSLIVGASRTEFLFRGGGGGSPPLCVRILPGPLLGNVTFPVWRVHKNTKKNNYIAQLCNPTAKNVKKLLTTLSTWSKSIGNDKMTGQDEGIMRDKMKR